MQDRVLEHLRLTKQELVDRAEPGQVSQSGAVVLDSDFAMPIVDTSLPYALPSIELFVAAAADRSISAMGTNDGLNAAWMPTIETFVGSVFSWLDGHNIDTKGDAYVTASITAAADVSDEAHFDDDQFAPDDGVGVVAIAADRNGSRVATEAISLTNLRTSRPLVLDEETQSAFALGDVSQDAFGANQLIVFPQFGQLHSGPGPCGSRDDVRHLLVLRVAT